MNLRGQAGLEYLMTYGWALIIIATIVGVLTFLVGSPAGKVNCTSSDPIKILLKSSNIVAGGTNPAPARVINVQNATGGIISGVTVLGAVGANTESGTFDLNTAPNTVANMAVGSLEKANMARVPAGANIYLYPAYNVAKATGDQILGSFQISYKDWSDYNKTVTIACQGKI